MQGEEMKWVKKSCSGRYECNFGEDWVSKKGEEMRWVEKC